MRSTQVSTDAGHDSPEPATAPNLGAAVLPVADAARAAAGRSSSIPMKTAGRRRRSASGCLVRSV
jgi:hypothetical protein